MIDVTKLENVKIEDIKMWDSPDFADAFIASAYSTELERDLSELELEWIQQNEYDFFYDEIISTIY